jgi:DNA polymerase-3 subunit delta'
VTWNVIGQERALAALSRAIEDPSRLSHAYLFVGPEHVGRATTARAFAQALNCERSSVPPTRPEGLFDLGGHPESLQAKRETEARSDAAIAPTSAGKPDAPATWFPASQGPPAEGPRPSALPEGADEPSEMNAVPCGTCRACRLIAEQKHPDVEWLGVGGVCEESEHRDHSADNSRDIRICQVRRLQRTVNLPPFEGRKRVIIVEPADSLTTEAANAFLKTLEEPPPYVVLVLLTSREEMLPETVRSRCRRIVFYGVPRHEIESALVERWGAEPEQATRLARLAQGRLGWAVAVLQDERLLIDRERTLDDIESLLAGGYSERFAYAASLGARFPRDPQAVRATLELWRGWWRDVLLAAAGKADLAAESERLDTLRSQASQYGVAGAVQALRAITNGRRHLEEHASPTLALEAMLLELPSARG